MQFDIRVNQQIRHVACDEDTPLLYVLRNDLALNGPKFGCGVGMCGACTVIADGEARRSCVLPMKALGTAEVLTLDGLASGERLHPIQAAFIAEQAAQCAYCSNGMIMAAKAFLDRKPAPTEAQVREALATNLCRCGVHNRIVRAVMRVVRERAL